MNCTSYVKNGTNSIIHLKRPRASYLMQPTLNPDTHCTSCGEPLSEYDHCWQCHYPPMDPKQDAAPAPYCNGQCGVCMCISSHSTSTATPAHG